MVAAVTMLSYYADPAVERRRRYIAFALGVLLGAVAASLFFIFRT
jgi:hypothetical protein